MRSLRCIAILELATVLMFCHASRATSLARMSVEQMAHASDAIVRAKCISSATNWEEGEIWTFTGFQIEESWKGATPSRVTVRLIGGKFGQITSHVSGVPQFHAGEDVVLFLQHAPRGNFSVVSWEQGTFRIGHNARDKSEVVTQDTASFPVFDASRREFETVGIRGLPLRDFRARVRKGIESDAWSKE